MSKEITPNREQCVEFYYQRDDYNEVSRLKLFVWVNKTASTLPVWTESSYNNDIVKGWKKVQVTLGHSLTALPYQILLEESVKVMTDRLRIYSVYVDDIFIKDESCLPQGDCDFEDGDTCTWTTDPYLSSILWQVASGDDTQLNRPTVDHR